MTFHTTNTRRFTALLAVVMLFMALLACTSNDSLFIKLTATPVPSLTPTPLQIETRFKQGDQLYAVDVQRIISLNETPGSLNGGSNAMLTCFRGSQVTVLDAGKNQSDPTDKSIYYKIDCGGGIEGWLTEAKLSPFAIDGGSSAVVKSTDGKGAPLYKETDVTSAVVGTCADGTKVKVNSVERSANLATNDNNLYDAIDCGGASGYTLDSMLVPAS